MCPVRSPACGQQVPVDVSHDEPAQQKEEVDCKVCSTDKRKSRLGEEKEIEVKQHHPKRGDAAQTIEARYPRRVTHGSNCGPNVTPGTPNDEIIYFFRAALGRRWHGCQGGGRFFTRRVNPKSGLSAAATFVTRDGQSHRRETSGWRGPLRANTLPPSV
jgi:hypothetical protein